MTAHGHRFVSVSVAALLAFRLAGGTVQAQSTLTIGIGTQDTTNTVTTGGVIRHLKLLGKHLPKTDKYADV